MKLLILDIQATGYPKFWDKLALEEPDNWPNIVSIAWILYDTETCKTLDVEYYVIKPVGWTIPPECNITQHYAIAIGVDLQETLEKLMKVECDAMVAHNMHFNYSVILNSMKWICRTPIPKFPQLLCTMRLSTDICGIMLRGCLKQPVLQELYQHCCGKSALAPKPSPYVSLDNTGVILKCIQSNETLLNKMKCVYLLSAQMINELV